MHVNRLGIVSLAAMFVFGAASAHADRPDAWITAKVKWQLLTDEHVKGTAVNVDTTDRRVTLHGRVASAEQRARAAELAQGIEGVREVRNLLVVGPIESSKNPATAQRAAAANRNDREIKTRVTETLSADKRLADDTITVKSVKSGVVVLAGKATSTYDHERAIRLAYTVDGVDRVASEIQTPNDDADLAIWRAAKKDEGATNEDAWDPMLTTRVKLKLLAAEDVPGLDINVDTTDGVVTLFGIVPTEEVKRIAQTKAASVDGVVRVQNEIQVVTDPNRDAVEAQDRKAQDRVEARLRAEPSLEDQNVNVEVHDGVARLTGKVDADYQRLAALVTARTTSGVTKVVDDVEVVPEQRAGKADD